MANSKSNLDQIKAALGDIEIPDNIKEAADKLDLYQRLQDFATDKNGGAVILDEFRTNARYELLDIFSDIEKGDVPDSTIVNKLRTIRATVRFLAIWDKLSAKEKTYQEIVDTELKRIVGGGTGA